MTATNEPSGSRRFALGLLAVGAVCLCAAVGLVYQVGTSYAAAIERAHDQQDLVAVAVARRDLRPGVPLTEDDLYVLEIERRMVPEGALADPAHAVGRIPRERILGNELVRTERLADPESGEGLNAVIPRGMRALSIVVQDGRAVSGMLNPGSYVDVLVTYPQSIDREVAETQTVLQAVFVLAVRDRLPEGVTLGREAERLFDPTVTLLVDAHQAEALAHAENTGRVHLSLRNDADEQLAQLHGIDVGALRRRLAISTAPRRVPPPEPLVAQSTEIRIIRGDLVQDIQIGDDRLW